MSYVPYSYRRRSRRTTRNRNNYHTFVKAGPYARIGRSVHNSPKGFWWGFKKGFGGAYNVAKKALSMASQVKRLINVEYKYVDGTIADATAINQPATANSLTLNRVALGTGESQRNGNKVLAKSLQLKFDIYRNSSETGVQCVRWFVILTHAYDGGDGFDLNHLFDLTKFESLINKDTDGNMIILKAGMITVDPNFQSQHVKLFLPLKFHTKFSGDAADDASIAMNALTFVIWSDKGANQPVISKFESRFDYIDN